MNCNENAGFLGRNSNLLHGFSVTAARDSMAYAENRKTKNFSKM